MHACPVRATSFRVILLTVLAETLTIIKRYVGLSLQGSGNQFQNLL
jgi:hypothetical protein